jgi:hypothetical protein
MNVSASAMRTSRPEAHVPEFHAARVLAGADAKECDAVAVRGIHIRLDLEHKPGQRRLAGRHLARR